MRGEGRSYEGSASAEGAPRPTRVMVHETSLYGAMEKGTRGRADGMAS